MYPTYSDAMLTERGWIQAKLIAPALKAKNIISYDT